MENILTRWATISFSRRTVLRGVAMANVLESRHFAPQPEWWQCDISSHSFKWGPRLIHVFVRCCGYGHGGQVVLRSSSVKAMTGFIGSHYVLGQTERRTRGHWHGFPPPGTLIGSVKYLRIFQELPVFSVTSAWCACRQSNAERISNFMLNQCWSSSSTDLQEKGKFSSRHFQWEHKYYGPHSVPRNLWKASCVLNSIETVTKAKPASHHRQLVPIDK
jgi:hypothetical protein